MAHADAHALTRSPYGASKTPPKSLRVPFLLPPIDTCLRGGLACGLVTELCGPPGASKTSLAISLLHSCVTRGVTPAAGPAAFQPASSSSGSDALVINTESRPTFMARIKNVFAQQDVLHMLDHVHVADSSCSKVATPSGAVTALINALTQAQTLIRQRARTKHARPIRLVVVDSVAMALGDTSTSDEEAAAARNQPRSLQTHWRVADLLKQIARDETGAPPVAVLVTNHVADAPSYAALAASPSLRAAVASKCGGGRVGGFEVQAHAGAYGVSRVVPALGLFWSQCVHVRLFVHRCAPDENAENANENENTLPLWEMHVAFAPHLPQDAVCRYTPSEISNRMKAK